MVSVFVADYVENDLNFVIQFLAGCRIDSYAARLVSGAGYYLYLFWPSIALASATALNINKAPKPQMPPAPIKAMISG
jgi:hypothetical protein